MNTIKLATACAVAAYCDAAYDLWGWDGVVGSALVLAGAIFAINMKWRKTNDDRTARQ
jgi:hypothetical protein